MLLPRLSLLVDGAAIRRQFGRRLMVIDESYETRRFW
jgi:hypothetical protein